LKLSTKQLSEISIYSPLTEGLSLQIQNVISGTTTSAGVTFLETSINPYPYVQVGSPDAGGLLTLEVISNTYLETKLTEWQVALLTDIGWNPPDESNPNFWLVAKADDTHELAKILIYAVHLVFGISEETWFTFGTAPIDLAMNNSGLFWHMRGASGIVCLPGQNVESTIEGKH